MTARIPARLSRKLSRRLAAERSSSATTTAISNPTTNVKAATARKLLRQPMVAVENASGAVAISVPMVPMPTCKPVSVAKRSGRNPRA